MSLILSKWHRKCSISGTRSSWRSSTNTLWRRQNKGVSSVTIIRWSHSWTKMLKEKPIRTTLRSWKRRQSRKDVCWNVKERGRLVSMLSFKLRTKRQWRTWISCLVTKKLERPLARTTMEQKLKSQSKMRIRMLQIRSQMLLVKIKLINFRIWLVFMNLKQVNRLAKFLPSWFPLIRCQLALKQE